MYNFISVDKHVVMLLSSAFIPTNVFQVSLCVLREHWHLCIHAARCQVG